MFTSLKISMKRELFFVNKLNDSAFLYYICTVCMCSVVYENVNLVRPSRSIITGCKVDRQTKFIL